MRPTEIIVWLRDPKIECWNFLERHVGKLTVSLPRVRVQNCDDEREFLDALPAARVAIVWHFHQEWLAKALKLEWLVTPAAGRDYFRITPRPGLKLEYGSFHGEIIGETVMAYLLCHCRGVRDTLELQRQHAWPRLLLAPRMRPLRGSRLTILGFGNIGRWVGRLAKPFGVALTGVKRRPVEPPDYFEPGDRIAGVEELDRILPSTDFLVISLPRSGETDTIIDGRRLDLLPTRAVVINVGRGDAVDETSLAAKLMEGKLAAAYLDVYREEPLPESSPLRRCPNVLLMPHASAIFPGYMDLFAREFIGKFVRRYGP